MIFIANWKMNPLTAKEAERMNNQIKQRLDEMMDKPDDLEIIICPPSIFLNSIKEDNKYLKYGVQNVAFAERGAYTGETSVNMVKNMGATYSIIGHSERKRFAAENDQMCAKKVRLCLEKGITPILCIGETQDEKKRGQTGIVIQNQLKIALGNLSLNDIKKVIIAYEPVWAISTQAGSSAGYPDSILGATIIIKKTLLDIYKQNIINDIRVVYGGSVDKENVEEYLKNGNLNGFLIGSASLNPLSFIAIIEKCLKYKKEKNKSKK